MSSQPITVSVVGLLLSTVISFAQTHKEQGQPSSTEHDKVQKQRTVVLSNETVVTTLRLSGVVPVAVPEGEAAWAVQVITRGGFSGTGKGTVTVTSAGIFACDRATARESKLLAPEVVQSVSQLVAGVRPFAQQSQQLISLCRDCYETTLVLSRREADGAVRTYIARWDDVTEGEVAEDVQEIYENVIKLAPYRNTRVARSHRRVDSASDETDKYLSHPAANRSFTRQHLCGYQSR